MFQTYDLSIALVDFIPSTLFIIGIGLIFLFLLKNTPDKRIAYGWLIGGIIASLGGFFKSTWKLIIAVTGTDLELLDNSLFVLQGIGFSILFLFLLIFLKFSEITKKKSVIPILFLAGWKMPFLLTMVITNILVLIMLIYLAKKINQIKAIIFFALTLILIFVMAGMSQTALSIIDQWISEIINSITQACFAFGALLIYKSK